MSDLFLSLAQPAACRSELSGAKGACLAQMAQAGLPVPDAFIVSTEVFKAAWEDLPDALLADCMAGQSGADEALCRALSAWPKARLDALDAACDALGYSAVSARSSSTAEDLEGASFAGQYETVLNVSGRDALVDAIGRVWASFFSPHAQAYRQRHQIDDADAAMAVVVQRQIDASAAGVLFTRDPQSGADHCVVSAALGLGEGVVSGSAPTDHWVIERTARTVRTVDIADKDRRVAVRPNGGIETVDVGPAQRGNAALTQAQLDDLVELGLRIETLFGAPQDIEFAVDGSLHILQARPITTLDDLAAPDEPWEDGVDDAYCWTKSRGPFTRLEQDYMVEYMVHARACYEEVGSRMTANHLYFVRNGYMYTRAPDVEPEELARRHAVQTERVDACTARGTTYFEAVQRGIIEDRLAQLGAQRRRAKSPADRLIYLESCLQMLAYVSGHLHWSMGRPDPLPGWHEEYEALTGRPQHEANVFLQAIDNRMTRLVGHLRKLAAIVQSDAGLRVLFAEGRFDDLETLTNSNTVQQFRRRFSAMLTVYGLRSGRGYGSSSGFQTPTWNMDPRIALEVIATYAEQDLDRLEQLEQGARRERRNATRRLRRQVSADPEKRARFEDALLRGQLHVRFLEDHNYYMEQCSGGTAREAIDAVGRDLVSRNAIDEADDVFHLSIEELRALAAADYPTDQRTLVAARKEEWARRKRMRPPATLGAAPEKKETREEETTERGRQGDRLVGVSASSGQASGRAVLVRSGERPRVHPGDILVASNVGPEWTPAFAVLGGLVLDEGSLSQHAAIVAREYRIPSVMQTREATSHIADGQQIVVDGDQGIVELRPSPI